MVQLHKFFFFNSSIVVLRGTKAPVLLKNFLSRDVPIGALSSNGTIIPIPISSFPLLVYLHSRKFIRYMDEAKSGVLVRARRPILLPDIIGRSSIETRARKALFHFILVLHFLLLESKGDFSYLESFCGVLCLLFFLTFFYLHEIGQRSVSGREEGKAQNFSLTGKSNDKMTRLGAPGTPKEESLVFGL